MSHPQGPPGPGRGPGHGYPYGPPAHGPAPVPGQNASSGYAPAGGPPYAPPGQPPAYGGRGGYGGPSGHVGHGGHGGHGYGAAPHAHLGHGAAPPPYGAPGAPHAGAYRPPPGGGPLFAGAAASGYEPPAVLAVPDPDRRRRITGLWLWILGMAAGTILNLAFHFLEIVGSKYPGRALTATLIGALFAFPPLLVYIAVPRLLDRYDPEPWWCLLMAFLWGAVVATGFAGMINTAVGIVFSALFGREAGTFVSTVISAPLSEELWKGLAILGFFHFLRREFDGVVDGIIYATFCALGFAAVENVTYYARAAAQGDDVLVATFVLRGVVAPWGHPLYTSMTGIGFGIARESSRTWVRWLAPIGGFFAGVFLHAVWNFVPTVLGQAFFVMLPLWLLFVLAFGGIVIALVVRKGRIIRRHLEDEVLVGNLSREELELVCSAFGRMKARFSWRGKTGLAFVRAASRLALAKWHTARAMRGHKGTISADFIVPLRQELRTLRAQMVARPAR